ncbi:MAG TPA: MDR family MFS transporter [Alphaproteobacteria bacterium]|nr:MDR family MFS transporter [Alphaproteobacteria bacterium]
MLDSDSPRRTRRSIVFAGALISMFMAAVEQTIVATSLPTIIAELGGFRVFSWVFAIYLLTQGASIPIYGKLADVYGRKRVYFAGAAIFLIGSALAGLSGSMLQLILFRALQGIGAGSIVSVPLTMMGDIYSAEERARVQGYLSSVWGVASVIGPAIGAFLVEHVGWQYVFWLNLPLGIVAIAIFAFYLHEDPKQRAHAIDYLGTFLFLAGLMALMLALIQGTSLPWAAVAALLAVAILCLALFYRIERRASEPTVPLAHFRNRIISVSGLGQFATGAVMIGVTTFVPTYVQGVMGGTPIVAGFALAAMSIGWPISSLVCGRLMAVASFRLNAALGSATLVAGAALLAALDPSRGPVFAGLGAFVIGLGMGFTNTTYTVAAQSSVEWHERGIATSLNLFMRNIGQALGAAMFGAILNFGIARELTGDPNILNRLMEPALRRAIAPAHLAELIHAIAASLHVVYLIAAAIAVAAFLIALRLPPGHNARSARPGSIQA